MSDNTRQSVIFDLDGVIIDSLSAHREAWKDEAKERGVAFSDSMYAQTFGRRNEDFIPELFGVSDSVAVADIAAHKEVLYRERFRAQPKLVAGVDAYIQQLAAQGIIISVATSTPKENMDMVFELFDWAQLFQSTTYGEEVPNGKPAPDIFLLAAERMGVDPRETIVFEDSLPGMEGAQHAGMAVVGVATTHTPEEVAGAGFAQFIVTDFHDPLLRQFAI